MLTAGTSCAKNLPLLQAPLRNGAWARATALGALSCPGGVRVTAGHGWWRGVCLGWLVAGWPDHLTKKSIQFGFLEVFFESFGSWRCWNSFQPLLIITRFDPWAMRRRKGVRWNFKEAPRRSFLNKQEGIHKRPEKPPRPQLSLKRTGPSQSGSLPSAHFLHLALREAANEKPLPGRRLLALRCYLLSHKHVRCAPAYRWRPMSDTLSGNQRWWRRRARSDLRWTAQR